MRIKITADSTCDLPPELVEKHDIGIIPMIVLKDDIPYRDQVEITPDDIFDYVESSRGICQTSAYNAADYGEIFRNYLKDYDAVIHVNISSGFSSCHQNACMAAAELANVFVIDSLNLSTGFGHIVLKVAELAEAGVPAQEIVSRASELAQKVETSFVIDTLKYLHKGGRCSSVAALGANVLKLKPCIEVIGGKMDVGRKYRGSFDKVILQYVQDKLQGRSDLDPGRIFITYAGRTPQAVVDEVVAAVKNLGYFDEILTSVAGCSVSNHCGPVCLGVLYFRK